MRQQQVDIIKDEMGSLGGRLDKGKLTMGYPQGRELRIFDRDSCNSKEACMRQIDRNLKAFNEEYKEIIKTKQIELDQVKQRYKIESEDVCKTFGSDGLCETFRKVEVPTNFMLISKEDKLEADVAQHDRNPYQTSNDSKGVFLEIPTPYCWSVDQFGFGDAWKACDPDDDSQKFQYKKTVHRNSACSGGDMNRDSGAQLEGYTAQSCRYLCELHSECAAATHWPIFEKDGQTFSGYCQMMNSLDDVEETLGSTCYEYTMNDKGKMLSRGSNPSLWADDNVMMRYVWSYASPI